MPWAFNMNRHHIFLIIPVKATIKLNSPSIFKPKFHFLPPTLDNGGKPQINGKDLWQTADHRKIGLYVFIYFSCGGADRRQKICGITVPHGSFLQGETKIRSGHDGYQSKSRAPHQVFNYSAVRGFFYIDRTTILKIVAIKRAIRKFF
jgi:hypothetical protein